MRTNNKSKADLSKTVKTSGNRKRKAKKRTRLNPLKAIRIFCLECSGVTLCETGNCLLHPYHTGRLFSYDDEIIRHKRTMPVELTPEESIKTVCRGCRKQFDRTQSYCRSSGCPFYNFGMRKICKEEREAVNLNS